MNIPKAIEILSESVELTDFAPDPDFIDALQLGIEALKRVKKHRPLYAGIYPHLLPGETKD